MSRKNPIDGLDRKLGQHRKRRANEVAILTKRLLYRRFVETAFGLHSARTRQCLRARTLCRRRRGMLSGGGICVITEPALHHLGDLPRRGGVKIAPLSQQVQQMIRNKMSELPGDRSR